MRSRSPFSHQAGVKDWQNTGTWGKQTGATSNYVRQFLNGYFVLNQSILPTNKVNTIQSSQERSRLNQLFIYVVCIRNRNSASSLNLAFSFLSALYTCLYNLLLRFFFFPCILQAITMKLFNLTICSLSCNCSCFATTQIICMGLQEQSNS